MDTQSAGVRHPRQPLFRRTFRSETFVLVKPLTVSREERLEPGTEIQGEDMPLYRLKSLYQRRRIGVKGHPWTDWALNSWELKGGQVTQRKQEAVQQVDAKVVAKEFRSAAQQTFGTNARTGLDKTLDQLKAKIDAALPSE